MNHTLWPLALDNDKKKKQQSSSSSSSSSTGHTTGSSHTQFDPLLFSSCCVDLYSNPYKTGSTAPFIHHYRQHSHPSQQQSNNNNNHQKQQQQDQEQEQPQEERLLYYYQQQNSLVSSGSSSSNSSNNSDEDKDDDKLLDTTTNTTANTNSSITISVSSTGARVMTDPLSATAAAAAAAADDDLDALLAQADSMISQASSSGGNPSIVIDGFAIDSDEEDNKDGDIVDVSMDSPNMPPKTINPVNNNMAPPQPPMNQQQQQQQQPKNEDPLLHPLHEDVVHQHNNNNHMNNQPAPPHAATAPLSSTTTTTTTHSTFSAASVTSAMRNLGVNADPSVLESQFKAQTSRFAANMSSMAQRFARGTTTPTGSNSSNGGTTTNNNGSIMSNSFVEGNIPPPMSVPTPPSSGNGAMMQTPNNNNNNSPYASQSNSLHGTSQAAAAAGVPMMNFELDTEQKTTLVEWHVRKLLPGERVIMFLHNLLHVSDSTGSFQYAAQPGSPVVWCCAMTYYRLIVFGTTQEVIMHVMNSANNGATTPGAEPPALLQHPFSAPAVWNASCWPPAFATVMELPLASMEKVEKTVYTASAAAQVSPAGGRPTSLMGLQVYAKQGRIWRITTPSYADTLRAHQALLTYAFPGRRNLGYLFAFESKRAQVVNSVVTDPATGQKTVSLALTRKRFDAVTEFQRQFQRTTSTSTATCTGSTTSSSTSTSTGTNGTTHLTTATNGGSTPTTPTPSSSPAVQPWKIWTQINSQYQLCMSYPNVLVGPASLDENNPDAVRLLQACAAFRSEQRLPALAWSSGMDGASIWRCSQPKIGLQGNRSSADELVLKHIMEAAKSANALREQPLPVRMDAHLLQIYTGASPQDLANTHWVKESNCALKILDLRPRSAAMANRTGGYGYENTSNYPGTTLQFCNIGNIHAVRDAYQKLTALCLNMSNNSNADINWGSALEDTKWLSHVRIILAASWETAFWVQVHRMPVLLHCSHGWDRTSQVSALAQLMLDPYYRTMEGFACLMEKDFMAFGHPFHTRCAHGEGKGGADGAGVGMPDPSGKGSTGVGNNSAPDEGQISPVFLQFLDCVWQIVQQYPECFEFTTAYLLELSDHIYSCRFGNMLCDTERERELVAGIRQRTYSVWDHLEQDPNDPNSDPKAKLWRNPHFDPSPAAGGGVLLMPMPTLLRNVTLWREKYARYGPKATQRWRNTEQSQL